MKINKLIFILFLFSGIFDCSAQEKLINDKSMYKSFCNSLRELYDNKKCVDLKILTEQLNNSYTDLDIKSCTKKTVDNIYKDCKKSVLILGRLFQTDNSEKDKLYIATGFVIGEDGICVTNHHVFEQHKQINEIGMAVMDYEGNVYNVTEVLAASENDDVAIFKIDNKGKKLHSLHLGDNSSVGESIHVISHPRQMFYNYTKGIVSRYYFYEKEHSKRMSITADFAVGSSGGPVLNDKGEVVGVVSSTFPIPNSKMVQMVVKEIIPVNSLRKLIKNNEE